MGNKSSSIDTIGLNNANYDNVSSTLPGGFKLGPQVEQVIQNIPLNQMGGNDDSDTEDSLGLADIFQKMEQNGGGMEETDDEVSDTSPFISSEMYNYLMKGGAKKKKQEKKSKKTKSKKQHKGKSKPEPETSATTESSLADSVLDDSELDYESSTAHTQPDQESVVTPIVKSEINTSDIRMITE